MPGTRGTAPLALPLALPGCAGATSSSTRSPSGARDPPRPVPRRGQAPPERELAARIDVSRATLRQALSELQTAGVVDVRRGRYGGAFVTRPPSADTGAGVDLGELDDAVRFRHILETSAARIVAERELGAEERERLISAERSRWMPLGSSAEDIEQFRALDARFHLTIAELTGIPSLAHAAATTRDRINAAARSDSVHPHERRAFVHASISGSSRRSSTMTPRRRRRWRPSTPRAPSGSCADSSRGTARQRSGEQDSPADEPACLLPVGGDEGLLVERLPVRADRVTVDHAPLPADHDAVGLLRAAEDEGGDRVMGAGEREAVEAEQREVGLPADRDGADVVAAQRPPNPRSPSRGRART